MNSIIILMDKNKFSQNFQQNWIFKQKKNVWTIFKIASISIDQKRSLCQCLKTFFSATDDQANKLERLSLVSLL